MSKFQISEENFWTSSVGTTKIRITFKILQKISEWKKRFWTAAPQSELFDVQIVRMYLLPKCVGNHFMQSFLETLPCTSLPSHQSVIKGQHQIFHQKRSGKNENQSKFDRIWKSKDANSVLEVPDQLLTSESLQLVSCSCSNFSNQFWLSRFKTWYGPCILEWKQIIDCFYQV